MTKRALQLLCLAGILLLPGCPVALVGAGAAAGIWVYDKNSDDTGELVVAAPPDVVFEEAVRYARTNGLDVRVYRPEMRVEYSTPENVDVAMVVFVVPGDPNVARLKVSARSTIRGRADLARQYALDLQERALRRADAGQAAG